jgi:TolB protein
MRPRILIPLTVAVLYGCTDQAPTSPETQVRIPGTPHLGTFAGSNGRIVFSGNGIQTMNADGTGLQTLSATGAAPQWSPDGSRIAFIDSPDQLDNEVFVMNADGSGRTQLTSNTSDEQAPSWSADGTKIGYSSDAGGGYQIYTVPAAGGTPAALTTGNGPNFGAAWSPNGTKIAFTSARDGHNEIYVMNADGTGQTRLTNDASESNYDPTWSPDGAKISFTHGAAIPDIYVMNADCSSQVNLTQSPTVDDYSAAWSPDGSKIVFIRTVIDRGDVIVMNANGSGQTNITNTTGIAESLPDWQPLPGPNIKLQIQQLISYLDQLGLVKGTVNSLKSPLNNAIIALDANNTSQACSYIADFISKVTAQSGKKFSAAIGADLVARAQAIASALGCVPGSKCYPDLPAPQLTLESTTTASGNVHFEFNVPNYASFPNELFAQAPDLPACGLNTSSSRSWVDIFDGNGNRLFGFCSFSQASDLNLLWLQTPIANWPAETYIQVTDRRCGITYTSNRLNMASIL